MNINHVLKKENIENIIPLSRLEVNKIATTVSAKICNAFPEHNINQSDLFISLARLNMYTAKMPNTSSSAKYFYKNNSIYFKNTLNFENLDTLSIHECIHFMQELKDENGYLLRMGLYNLEKFKDCGLALNEAAVQTMASICEGCKEDSVRYYNMDINTISPDYYPLECALLKQMIYFTGSYSLVHSTLFSDDTFKNSFIAKSSSKTYYEIEKNFDIILTLQDKVNIISLELQESNESNIRRIKNLNLKIDKLKTQISNLCINTQNLIIQDCFTKEFNSIKNMNDLKNFQNHLYNFKDILIYADNASYYNTFYCDIMAKLDEKREVLNKNGVIAFIERDLALVEADMFSINIFKKLINKIKLLINIESSEKLSSASKSNSKV